MLLDLRTYIGAYVIIEAGHNCEQCSSNAVAVILIFSNIPKNYLKPRGKKFRLDKYKACLQLRVISGLSDDKQQEPQATGQLPARPLPGPPRWETVVHLSPPLTSERHPCHHAVSHCHSSCFLHPNQPPSVKNGQTVDSRQKIAPAGICHGNSRDNTTHWVQWG